MTGTVVGGGAVMGPANKAVMKIVCHSESHIVELSDGSIWQIFPGDIDLTLGWLPTTELQVVDLADELSSHALTNPDDGSYVRVRRLGGRWPTTKVKDALKGG